ncbi:MAG TPA: ubiquinone/menaquinone biosynthesis methyltransferase [Acidimicrobiales bacterium]|nr:ubiquinone/menaquinone biosynthesis methyltransferase [Acidimicrobiales bacterium]
MALPVGDEKVRAVRSMFDSIAPRYDLLNRVLTLGMDVGWRKRTVRSLGLTQESVIADLACGTGDFCREITKMGYVPLGFDLSFGMLAAARTEAPLVHSDALRLPLPDGAVDGLTCGFALRNFVDLGGAFAEMARIIRPGGRLAILEVAEPSNRVLRYGHGVYFGNVVPFVGGLISDASAYQYLPKSVEYLPEPDVMLQMLADVGFTEVDRTLLSGGISQLVTATRRAL